MSHTKTVAFALLAALPLFAQAQTPAAASAAQPAAELVLITGRVNATGPGGSRELAKGDAVFVGDTLLVGANSYANLKFADGGRILLRPNTDFTVEAYRYTPAAAPAAADPAAPRTKPATPVGQQQAFFRLLRGGFRAISGLIGQADRQDYRVTTPVATIGIRGTDYEVQICSDDCPPTPGQAGSGAVQVAANDLSGLELAQQGVIGGGSTTPPPGQGGVLLATNEGTVVMKTRTGEYLVKVGEVAFALTNGQVFMLPVVPDALLVHPTPSPENCQ